MLWLGGGTTSGLTPEALPPVTILSTALMAAVCTRTPPTMEEPLRSPMGGCMEYRDLIGIPFRLHGRSPQDGLDCYGLVMEIYRRMGIELQDYDYDDSPRNTGTDLFEEHKTNDFVEVKGKPCEGDVIVLGNGMGTHCGVFVRGGRVLHAKDNVGVVSESMRTLKPFIVGVHRHKCLA